MDSKDYQDILNYVKYKEYPKCEISKEFKSNWKKKCKKFKVDKGDLLFIHPVHKELKVIQEHEKLDIIKSKHGITEIKHFGLNKTRKEVSSHYYWKTIAKDVTSFCKNCEKCKEDANSKQPSQRTKINNLLLKKEIDIQNYVVPVSMQTSSKTNEESQTLLHFNHNDWVLFLSEPLLAKRTHKGNNAVVLLINKNTDWVEAKAITNIESTKEIGQLILDTLCKHAFINTIFLNHNNSFKDRLINYINSKVNHPIDFKYLDGPIKQGENFNSILRFCLPILPNGSYLWDKYLMKFIFALNTYPLGNNSPYLAVCPYKKFYGRDPCLPDRLTYQNVNLMNYTIKILEVFKIKSQDVY